MDLKKKQKKRKHSFKTFLRLTTVTPPKFSIKGLQIPPMWKLTIIYVTKKDKICTRSQRLCMKTRLFALKTSSKLALTPIIWAQSIRSSTRKLRREKKIALEVFKKLGSLTRTSARKLRQRRGIKRILSRI